MAEDFTLKVYAEKYIKAIKCNRLVPRQDGESCFCGRTREEHDVLNSPFDVPWDKDRDLVEMVTNAYGEMKLEGFKVFAGTKIKFIRASWSNDVFERLYYIMTEIWKFPKPDLIISIHGSAENMIPFTNEQKCAFKRGLINVSKTASTWIITGGFDRGVPELVGEAANDNKIASQPKTFTVIGISHWLTVYNRKNLVSKDGEITYLNAKYPFTVKGMAPLNPNHDAFILYDSQIEEDFEKEMEFRVEFEEYASKKANCGTVHVIVEGGKECILMVNKALSLKIPLVVMKGSNWAADLICDIVESEKKLEIDVIKDGLEKYKKEGLDEKELRDRISSLCNDREKNLIHVFSMSDHNKSLDIAILDAAFSYGKLFEIEEGMITYEKRLNMTMIFDRPDVAKKLFMETPVLNEESIKKILQKYFQKALEEDKWKFVHLFLSRGTPVEYFLTKDIFEYLYSDKFMKANVSTVVVEILEIVIKNTNKKNYMKNSILRIGPVIENLTQNLIRHMYPEIYPFSRYMETIWCKTHKTPKLTNSTTYPPVDKSKKIMKQSKKIMKQSKEIMNQPKKIRDLSMKMMKQLNERIYTEQDLFIWALLTQRWELSKIFWENGKDHIGSALIATVICNSLIDIARQEKEVDMEETLRSYREHYENLAIKILAEAYDRDKIRAHFLLIRALPYWNRVTCMEIAHRGVLINFLSQCACQTRLNTIWLGGMLNTSNPLFLAYLTCEVFHSDEPKEKSEISQSKQKCTETNDELNEKCFEKFRTDHKHAFQHVSISQTLYRYIHAPVTKFVVHVIFYLAFLITFSYTVLVELRPLYDNNTNDISFNYSRQTEYTVYAYIGSSIIEEIRQALFSYQYGTFEEKLLYWILSNWNIFDLLLYILVIIAFTLRFIRTIDFVYSRTIFSITVTMFFMRFLQFYHASPYLGPKVISISRMMKDILFFLALYVVAIFAYGVFAWSLLYSNSPLNNLLFRNIIFFPYFQSFGDLNLEFVEGQKPSPFTNTTATPNTAVVVGFALYMAFTNALLMNLLVAMFGITYQKVEENSNRIWAYNRYRLIEEFYNRPLLPPPLNLLEIPWIIHRYIRMKWSDKVRQKNNEFVVHLCHDEDVRSAGFEQQCLEKIFLDDPMLKLQYEDDKVLSSSSLMESLNQMKGELKVLSESVHRVRGHQQGVGPPATTSKHKSLTTVA